MRIAACLWGLPGDPVAADSRFMEMAGGKRYMAKALDDSNGGIDVP